MAQVWNTLHQVWYNCTVNGRDSPINCLKNSAILFSGLCEVVGADFATNDRGCPSVPMDNTQKNGALTGSSQLWTKSRQSKWAPICSKSEQSAPIYSKSEQSALIYSKSEQFAPIYSKSEQSAPIYSKAEQQHSVRLSVFNCYQLQYFDCFPVASTSYSTATSSSALNATKGI